jgi:signal transduction histidine kinase
MGIMALGVPEFIDSVGGFVISHRAAIVLCSSAMALIFATVMLLPRHDVLLAENWEGRNWPKLNWPGLNWTKLNWAKLIGWAFLIFFFQYMARFVQITSGASWLRILFVLGSTLNNLCFLEAARILLNRAPSPFKWPIVLAVISVVAAILGDDNSTITRLPDATFSALSLGWIGYATAANLRFSRRWGLGQMAVATGVLYALINVLYAFNPLLAKLVAGGEGTVNTLDMFDAFVFAVALIFKFALFLPAYFLLTVLLTSSSNFKRILDEVTHSRQDYLSGQGVIKTFGERLEADHVDLIVKLPDPQQLFTRFHWPKSESDRPGERAEFRLTPKTLISQVFQTGAEYFYPDMNARPVGQHASVEELTANSLIMCPVKFHGAVIGCLKVELHQARQFNYAALQMVKSTAALLAPVVQDYRELDALNQLSYRFAKLQVGEATLDLPTANKHVAEVLQEVLTPLAIGLFVEIGFKSSKAILPLDNESQRLLEDQPVKYCEWKETITNGQGESILILSNPLTITTRMTEESPRPLGSLLLAIPAKNDAIDKPTLSSFPLHRRAVSSLAADALLDLARDHFGSLLKDFSISLNKEATNLDIWLADVKWTAKQAGLAWVVATQPGDQELIGSSRGIELLKSLPPEARQELDDENKLLGGVVVSPEVCDTHHVVRINLRDSHQKLWFGVSRAGFGIELDFDSPWKLFLEHFAEIADAAMVGMITAKELNSLQIQAAQYQGLATVAVTTGTLIHQIVNLAKEQLNPSASLLEAITTSDIHLPDRYKELIQIIKDSAGRQFEFTRALTNVTRLDERRPCSLLEAAKHARDLFKTSLAQRSIDLNINVDPNLKLDIPYHIAALSLANLISNAKDAIDKNGAIWIEAGEDGSVVFCRVRDTGPGVPEKIRPRIFDLGFHASPNGNGWGLYLVKRSLVENGGDVELTEPGPSDTTFTLHFPKPRQERKHGPQ